MQQVLVLVLATFLSVVSLADDITPVEDFGKIIVRTPDYKDKRVAQTNLSIQSEGASKDIGVDKAYDVLAGEVCLNVSTTMLPPVKQCGIVVKPNQTTTVKLAAVTFDWDEEVLKVDFGLLPSFMINFFEKTTKGAKQHISFNEVLKTNVYLAPAVKFHVFYNTPDVLKGQDFAMDLVAGKINVIDITPQDKRVRINLVRVDERKFKQVKNNYASLQLRNLNSGVPKIKGAHHSNQIFNQKDNTYYIHSSQILGNLSSKEFYVYPLSTAEQKRHRIEYVVNNVLKVLKPVAGEALELQIKTFNVNHFEDKGPGSYLVYQLDPLGKDDFEFEKVLKEPYSRYSDRLVYRDTNSSIDLPKGWKYRFDFYIKDDLGNFSMEDQVEVDLR